MMRLIPVALAIALAMMVVPATANDGDDDKGFSVCERSAHKMFESCRFEVNEEFHSMIAKCINFGDADERVECKKEAREVRREDKEGCGEQREARSAKRGLRTPG